ncbi:MAG: YraN family protein [Desulfuromonas sp.]|nr:MAG: YraN family protein [Desulfuromonas sp.]
MSEARLALGRWGEDAAAAHLKQAGLKIVTRNVRTPVGEIDLLARQGKTWVFVEVKTRRSRRCGTPAEAVTPRKQQQIIRTARWYLAENRLEESEVRFDVVSVALADGEVEIEHLPAAFEVECV